MKILIVFLVSIATSHALASGTTDCRKADWTAMVKWAEAFHHRYGITLNGHTTQGMPCELNIWPDQNRSYYISLGTSTSGRTGPGEFTYIGTFINPDNTLNGVCEVRKIEVTPHAAHIQWTQDEMGAPGVLEHDLLIHMDTFGNVTQAQGSSSYWPSSTCLFK